MDQQAPQNVDDSDTQQVSSADGSSQQSQGSLPATPPNVASDSDLIEKVWVDKAKEIVEHTRDNPYEQQKAMSKFKADYMKKRYNKDVNTPND